MRSAAIVFFLDLWWSLTWVSDHWQALCLATSSNSNSFALRYDLDKKLDFEQRKLAKDGRSSR